MGSQGDAQSGKRRTEERRELHSNYGVYSKRYGPHIMLQMKGLQWGILHNMP